LTSDAFEMQVLGGNTAQKIRFTVHLIFIRDKVKYDYSFNPDFDVCQMCIKYVMALPIHLVCVKEEVKCGLNFDPTVKGRIKYLMDLSFI